MGSVRAVADFAFSVLVDERIVQAASAREIEIGPGRYAILVFPLLDTPVNCLRQVSVELYKSGGVGTLRGMSFYPSDEFDAAEYREGHPIGATTLIDSMPRGDLLETPGRDVGWASFDVSELYVTWASGDPFPTSQEWVPKDQPVVLQLRPKVLDTGESARFVSSEGNGKRAPRLAWAAAEDCAG